jgi:phosphotransferase system HPr (HPr) family protein
MRPKAVFAETANRFQSDIQVSWEGRVINGKSMWDLMLLGATHGAQMILEANGPDAEEALTALAMVIETDKLPGDLD